MCMILTAIRERIGLISTLNFALILGICLTIFVPYSHASNERCAALLSGLNIPSKITRAVERYWDHPDTNLLAAKIRNGENIWIPKNPFRIGAKVTEKDNVLRIVITILSSPQFVYGWGNFSVALLNRTSPRFDPTLPKVIAGVVKGALERKEDNPDLHTLQVLAPSLMNGSLGRMLRNFGFDNGEGKVGFRETGQIVIGNSEFLELSIDLRTIE